MFAITKLDKIMLPISLIVFSLFVMLAVYTNLAYDQLKINNRKGEIDGQDRGQAGSQAGSQVGIQVGGQVKRQVEGQVESQEVSSARSPKGTCWY